MQSSGRFKGISNANWIRADKRIYSLQAEALRANKSVRRPVTTGKSLVLYVF